jgi:hypothetical protein
MATFEGRQSFTALPNWILKKQAETPGWLSCSEFCVLFALQSFASGCTDRDGVYPSYKTLCAYASVSKRTAIACVKSLETKGLIEKQERSDDRGCISNIYFLKIWNHEPPASLLTEPRCSEVTTPVKEIHHPGANAAPKQEPLNKNQLTKENPPICPPLRSRARAKVEAVELPDWLEEHRGHLELWLENRRKKHRSNPEITKLTIKGLMYARELGVLAEYCEYASEMNWMSLGFAGHRELIQKLAKEHGKVVKPDKPAMAEIVYTLGVNR